jgi:hypothetical protein
VAEFNLLGPAYDESGLAIADFSSLFGTLRALARGVDETADYLAARLRDRGRNRA